MGGGSQETYQMKIGLILECQKDGPDQKVFEPLVRKIAPPKSSVVSRTLGNKPNVLEKCGAVAAELLADKCDRVIVIWDLWPSWEQDAPPCRKTDREAAIASLTAAEVDPARVRLLCVEQMLESWILADERALKAQLEAWSHPHKLKKFTVSKGAVLDTKPKKLLRRLFRECGCWPYEEADHAHLIAARWPDLSRVKRLETFQRFVRAIVT